MPKTIKLKLRAATGKVVIVVDAEPIDIEGMDLCLHHAVYYVKDKPHVSLDGWQITEEESGFRFCGGPDRSREKVIEDARKIIKKMGIDAIKKRIAEKLAGFV